MEERPGGEGAARPAGHESRAAGASRRGGAAAHLQADPRHHPHSLGAGRDAARRMWMVARVSLKVSGCTIHIRSVQVAMLLDDKVGYVQLSPVSETSASELTEAVGGLVQKGMKSLILDLREC